MPKPKAFFRCSSCGSVAPRWEGRCYRCGNWNTLVEELPACVLGRAQNAGSERPCRIGEVDEAASRVLSTGVTEADHVLGGGLVPGSVTLLGGEPGIGKSTLVLQILASIASQGATALYVSAEESQQQVRARAQRLGVLDDRLWVVAEHRVEAIVAHLSTVEPRVLVIDSIQTIQDLSIAAAAGSASQVRECTLRLVGEAKARQLAIVLVGHVTKDGALAGPRLLEHLVDTVLTFDGDRYHTLRFLRAVKHRFGATNEVGMFEMTERGLVPVADPSRLFLADRRPDAAGSIVVPTVDGHRSLLVEVQALAAPTRSQLARRIVQGLDGGRFPMVIAVLQQHAGVRLHDCDVYASAVGGVRVTEPAADLAVALATASAALNQPLAADLVAFGEVGLTGEVRQVTHYERRLAEARRLGFTRAIVPPSSPPGAPGIEIIRVHSVNEAIDAAFRCTPSSSAGALAPVLVDPRVACAPPQPQPQPQPTTQGSGPGRSSGWLRASSGP
ncbi:MAG: DNA repair protein RadA [Acidimicrobiales bacterium]|nr:DNA repair protein RadA [Acidimicrobiales bacterium]